MKRMTNLTHKFVEFIPEIMEEGTLYVSMENATVIHKCCCGCGNEVVTPVSPTDWQLTFDGRAITLYPSIGNWGFDCRSHYWIRGGKVKWSGQWSDEEIEAGRAADLVAKKEYFAEVSAAPNDFPSNEKKSQDSNVPDDRFLQKLWRRIWR
jgi:hypothetical protein